MILLQVLGLAIAVSFFQLLFPVFTQIVVDKVIVENDIGLLKMILLGMLAALVFVQLATLAQEYLLAFAAVRLDTAVFDFLSRRLLSLPMSYFTNRRTGDIQRRLEGARQVRQLAVQQGVGALLAVVFLIGALVLMAMYSPLLTIAFLATTPLYVGLMIFSVKVLRPLYHRMEESQGQIQFASDRCDQRDRGCKGGSGRGLISRRHAERVSLGLAKTFQGDVHRDVVGQRPANYWSPIYCDFPVGRCHASHSRQFECRWFCCV